MFHTSSNRTNTLVFSTLIFIIFMVSQEVAKGQNCQASSLITNFTSLQLPNIQCQVGYSPDRIRGQCRPYDQMFDEYYGKACTQTSECALTSFVCSESSKICVPQKTRKEGDACLARESCIRGDNCFNGKCTWLTEVKDRKVGQQCFQNDYSTNTKHLCEPQHQCNIQDFNSFTGVCFEILMIDVGGVCGTNTTTFQNRNCKSELDCSPTSRTCVKRSYTAKEGETCQYYTTDSYVNCLPNLECMSGKCYQFISGGIGDSCNMINETRYYICDSKHSCYNQKCVPLVSSDVGGKCDTSNSDGIFNCKRFDSSYCFNNTCMAIGKLGDSCAHKLDSCDTSLICKNNGGSFTCQLPAIKNQSCSSNSDCSAGLTCKFSQCTNLNGKISGETCAQQSDCDSGLCLNNICSLNYNQTTCNNDNSCQVYGSKCSCGSGKETSLQSGVCANLKRCQAFYTNAVVCMSNNGKTSPVHFFDRYSSVYKACVKEYSQLYSCLRIGLTEAGLSPAIPISGVDIYADFPLDPTPVKPFSCGSFSTLDTEVCSGFGQCIAENTCKCLPKFTGQYCQTIMADDPPTPKPSTSPPVPDNSNTLDRNGTNVGALSEGQRIGEGSCKVLVESKIVQVQVLSRHCDRSPVSDYQIPTDPWDWQSYFSKYSYVNGFNPSVPIEFGEGQLTGLGLQQCSKVGQFINARYLSRIVDETGEPNPNVISDLLYPDNGDNRATAHWNPRDFRFYATDYDRTLFSVFSISQSMFPAGSGPIADVSINGEVNALPNQMQPIPVYTKERVNELWMSAYSKCPTIDVKNEEFQQSAEFFKIMEKYKPLLTIISNITGIPFDTSLKTSSSENNILNMIQNFINPENKKDKKIPFYKILADREFAEEYFRESFSYPNWETIDFANFYLVYDLLNVQYSHKQLKLQEILKIWDKVLELGDVSTFMAFNRKVQGKLGGGPLVQNMIVEMNKMIDKLTGSFTPIPPNNYGADLSSSKTLPYKYVHYSAHDVSILSLMAALKLSDDYIDLQRNPPYGSQILLELHQSDLVPVGQKPTIDDFYIKIVYNRGYNDNRFTEYTLKSLGGKGCMPGKDSMFNCSFTSFKSICEQDAIPENWCMECKNTQADICIQEIYNHQRSLTTVFWVLLAILLGFLFLTCFLVCVLAVSRTRLSRWIRGEITTDLETKSQPGSLYQNIQ